MTGSTAISGSCARSHATTHGSGVGFVRSLRTLASTKYFAAHPSTQSRWGRRSPSADRRVAMQWRPRSAESHAGRGDSPHDRHALRRIPGIGVAFPVVRTRQQFRPFQPRVGLRVKPTLQIGPLLAPGEDHSRIGDLARLATAGNGDDLPLAEQGLAECASSLEATERS